MQNNLNAFPLVLINDTLKRGCLYISLDYLILSIDAFADILQLMCNSFRKQI